MYAPLEHAFTGASKLYPRVQFGYSVFRFSTPVIKSMAVTDTKAGRLDRFQIESTPGRYSFLVRHPSHGHFCGYTIVSENKWESDLVRQRQIREACDDLGVPISFVGYNNAIVSWCEYTQRGKLSIPVRLNNTGPDFILGFTTQGIKNQLGLIPDYPIWEQFLGKFSDTIHGMLA